MDQEFIWYTTEDMRLVVDEPAEGRVVLPWSHAQQLTEVPPPEWLAYEGGWLVTEAWATLVYEVAAVGVGTQFRGGDMTVWWGTSKSVIAHETPESEAVFVGGERYVLADIPLEVPKGGLVIPSGEPARLMLAGYLATDLLDSFEVITGATHLRVNATPWLGPVPDWQLQETVTGDMAGCVQGTARTNTHMLEVSGPMRVELEMTAGSGHPDLDLYIYGPDGEWVTRAHGPGPTETLDLLSPQLYQGNGTYRAEVRSYCPAGLEYELRLLA